MKIFLEILSLLVPYLLFPSVRLSVRHDVLQLHEQMHDISHHMLAIDFLVTFATRKLQGNCHRGIQPLETGLGEQSDVDVQTWV